MVDAAASVLSEIRVLELMKKHNLRLREKVERIIKMEESIANGKIIDKDEEVLLRSKPLIAAKIEALEYFLSAAQKELGLSPTSTVSIDEHESETPSTLGSNQHTAEVDSSALALEELLYVIYFGSLFDVKPQSDSSWTRMLERKCCLTRDNATNNGTEPLSENDLDLISMMSSLLISNPENYSLPHKNVLEQFIKHAKHWVAKPDRPIGCQNSMQKP